MSVATTVSAARSHESSATISISGAVDSTLTIEQLGFRSLVLTGSLTATVNVFFPATSSDIGSWWIVTNSTSGAYSVTCKNTTRSEEHTSELQSHSFISYAAFCL